MSAHSIAHAARNYLQAVTFRIFIVRQTMEALGPDFQQHDKYQDELDHLETLLERALIMTDHMKETDAILKIEYTETLFPDPLVIVTFEQSDATLQVAMLSGEVTILTGDTK